MAGCHGLQNTDREFLTQGYAANSVIWGVNGAITPRMTPANSEATYIRAGLAQGIGNGRTRMNFGGIETRQGNVRWLN
jgi:hypothetical protein